MQQAIKKIFIALFVILVFVSMKSFVYAQQDNSNTTLEEAEVQSVTLNSNNEKKVTLLILSGVLRGKNVITQDLITQSPAELHYAKGDHIIVSVSKKAEGGYAIYINDYDRRFALVVLGMIFFILILLVARVQAVTSLIGMAISFFMIAQIIIPNILRGNDPLLVTLISALFIIPITYYLAHGFNKKTTVAIVGTFITLCIIGLLAYLFTYLTKLTGYANEDAFYLQTTQGGQIDVKSLLLAGIVIGGLAVLNDITISQASIVSSLRKSNRTLRFSQLYNHAMDVGHDHVASLVNTLILVYAGASLPLFILFYNSSVGFSLLANQEIIATEIVRTLVSSIGIIAAVPITTALAAYLFHKD